MTVGDHDGGCGGHNEGYMGDDSVDAGKNDDAGLLLLID